MRHDWVFDVLSDLQDYATRNELPGLAEKVSEALDEARREIGALAEDAGTEGPDAPPDGPPPGRKIH
jgi:hypothetical protein